MSLPYIDVMKKAKNTFKNFTETLNDSRIEITTILSPKPLKFIGHSKC
jgi:hypothetical protein